MRSPFNEKLGISVQDLEDGRVQLTLETGPEWTNEVGSVHGGITMSLLDGAMGRAVGRALSPGDLCATVQFSAQFLAPAQGRVTATGRVVKRGRRAAFAEAECVREDGTIIARAHGTWSVRTAGASER
jgi:uncharacterized protein (TIGR00369 family)